MLTNIDQQFAQVRSDIAECCHDCDDGCQRDKTVAALSAIERHIQDMEKALDVLRWSTGEDCWCGTKSVDDADWHTPKCAAVRAALPAREKGEE